jgi:hypothetical protein
VEVIEIIPALSGDEKRGGTSRLPLGHPMLACLKPGRIEPQRSPWGNRAWACRANEASTTQCPSRTIWNFGKVRNGHQQPDPPFLD